MNREEQMKIDELRIIRSIVTYLAHYRLLRVDTVRLDVEARLEIVRKTLADVEDQLHKMGYCLEGAALPDQGTSYFANDPYSLFSGNLLCEFGTVPMCSS